MCVSTSNRQTLFSTHNSQERLYERRSLRLLVTNSSKTTFEENITLFKQRLRYRGYPDKLLDKTLTEVNFSDAILMSKWHLIENQPLREEIYKDPPLLSYRKGRSLKDFLIRAKL